MANLICCTMLQGSQAFGRDLATRCRLWMRVPWRAGVRKLMRRLQICNETNRAVPILRAPSEQEHARSDSETVPASSHIPTSKLRALPRRAPGAADDPRFYHAAVLELHSQRALRRLHFAALHEPRHGQLVA